MPLSAKFSRRQFALRLLAACLALVSVTALQVTAKELDISGSTTLQPALEELARAYEHSPTRLRVNGVGSAEGIAALLQGTTDIASSSRFITPEELARADELGVYPVPFQVAHDAIIPIVHKSNPLRSLSIAQLRDIYLGRVGNWSQVGGVERKIRVVTREPGSGTLDVWQQLVTGGASGENATMVSSSEQVVRMVSKNRRAIGYIGLGNLSANVKPLRVEGVIGSLSNVRSGVYPLSRALFLFTNGWPQGQTQAFINFVLDPDKGQRVVEKAGFIPLYDHRSH